MIYTKLLLLVSLFVYTQLFGIFTYAATTTGSAPWVGHDLTGKVCAGKGQGYGPYDYTNPNHRGENLSTVEGAHFKKNIENLHSNKVGVKGIPQYDIDYTIRAFPNHHRALYAMMRFQLRKSSSFETNVPRSECYFQRAIRFKPDDYRVMQLYANYLVKRKHPEMAIGVYNQALRIENVPLDINYSLGLLYFDLKEYDKAVEQAKIVYAGGFKKSNLKNKLKKIKRWPVE